MNSAGGIGAFLLVDQKPEADVGARPDEPAPVRVVPAPTPVEDGEDDGDEEESAEDDGGDEGGGGGFFKKIFKR